MRRTVRQASLLLALDDANEVVLEQRVTQTLEMSYQEKKANDDCPLVEELVWLYPDTDICNIILHEMSSPLHDVSLMSCLN